MNRSLHWGVRLAIEPPQIQLPSHQISSYRATAYPTTKPYIAYPANEPLHIQLPNHTSHIQLPSHRISNNELSNLQECATTSRRISHQINKDGSPNLQEWATVPHLQQWATTTTIFIIGQVVGMLWLATWFLQLVTSAGQPPPSQHQLLVPQLPAAPYGLNPFRIDSHTQDQV